MAGMTTERTVKYRILTASTYTHTLTHRLGTVGGPFKQCIHACIKYKYSHSRIIASYVLTTPRTLYVTRVGSLDLQFSRT